MLLWKNHKNRVVASQLMKLKDELSQLQDYIDNDIDQRFTIWNENFVLRQFRVVQNAYDRLARDRDNLLRDNTRLHDDLLARSAILECEMYDDRTSSSYERRERLSLID